MDSVSYIRSQSIALIVPLLRDRPEQEQNILQSGVQLTDAQLDDARLVGVSSPERERLLRVEQIPPPKYAVSSERHHVVTCVR